MAWIYAGGLTDTSFTTGYSGAAWQPQNFVYGGHFVIASAGTVTQFGVYGSDEGVGQPNLKFGLYDDAGNLVAQSTGQFTSSTIQWYNSAALSQALSPGTYYLMVSASSADAAYGYSSGGAGSYATEAYATFPQSTETISEQAEANQLYGVRMDFTAGSSQSQAPRSLHQFRMRRSA